VPHIPTVRLRARFAYPTARAAHDLPGGRILVDAPARDVRIHRGAHQHRQPGDGKRQGRGIPCYRAAMGIALSEAALRLLDGRNYAVLATVNPDGSPQTSVMWVGRDGSDLLFSTVEGRVKHRNMLRDPRVSVTVIDSADPENYVELRGRVSMKPDDGRQVDTQLSRKYDGRDPDEDRPGAVRVVVRMTVEKAAGYAAQVGRTIA
jgi:PPOX class probable F420-dependent enzyme